MREPDAATDAATLVAAGLAARTTPLRQETFLHELLAHSAAGLSILEGDRQAAEALYRLADAVVARTNDRCGPAALPYDSGGVVANVGRGGRAHLMRRLLSAGLLHASNAARRLSVMVA
jgi:hypothetical protein